MVNSQMIKEVSEAFKIDERVEKVPSAIPVCEVNPKVIKNIRSIATSTSSTSQTIVTTPIDQDFYLVGCTLSVTKDATATSVGTSITYTDEYSLSSSLCRIAGLTLTPQSQTVSVQLTHPILVKRNTAINLTNSTNVANIFAQAIIFYFIDEVN